VDHKELRAPINIELTVVSCSLLGMVKTDPAPPLIHDCDIKFVVMQEPAVKRHSKCETDTGGATPESAPTPK
jgi:hypothetical protein